MGHRDRDGAEIVESDWVGGHRLRGDSLGRCHPYPHALVLGGFARAIILKRRRGRFKPPEPPWGRENLGKTGSPSCGSTIVEANRRVSQVELIRTSLNGVAANIDRVV
jgi:hypothetical protein